MTTKNLDTPPEEQPDRFAEHSEVAFRGAELAALYWAKFHGNPFSRRADKTLPPEVEVALDELVTYATGGLIGLDRHVKPEDALRRGFVMGYRFAKAEMAGDLIEGDDDDEDDNGGFEDLFKPQPPKGAL